MIDLHATRAGLIAEIGAPDAPLSLEDLCDARFARADAVHGRICGGSKRELFQVLELLLSARYGAAPRAERIRDLLGPLRHGLGNAHKHGNRRDESKRIEVEVVATRRGALLAIRDEGDGFDTALTVQRLRRGEVYFHVGGSGLAALDAARSTVAFEDGGRTTLIRYLASLPATSPPAASAATVDTDAWARGLAAELDGVTAEGTEALELRVVAVESGNANEPVRLRCLLRGRRSGGAVSRVLSGRLFATPALADQDQAGAAALRARLHGSEVHIPEPIVRPAAEPRLALYDFDPWLDLSEYLDQRRGGSMHRVARRIGAWLAGLHRSPLDVPGEPSAAVVERARSDAERVVADLDRVDPRGARRARALVAELVRRAEAGALARTMLVHGGFGFHCIHYGVDSRFYLDRFAGLRRSHPALDLGAFLADMVRLPAPAFDAEAVRAGWEQLRNSYVGAGGEPAALAATPLFAACALLGGLDGFPEEAGRESARAILASLDALERCVHPPPGGVASVD